MLHTLFGKALEQQVEEYSGPDQLGTSEEIERTSNIYQDDEYLIL